MRARSVGALVVVNAGRPIGMLTDRDIAVEVVAMGMDPDSTRVGDVMRKKPVRSRKIAGSSTRPRRSPGRAYGGCRWLAPRAFWWVIAVDDLFILLGNELGHMAGALAAGLRKAS